MKYRLHANNRWMPTETFCLRYGVNSDTIYMNRYLGRYPQDILDDGYIDTYYFLNRLALRERIRHEAHDLYYFLNRYWNNSELAYMLNKVYPSANATTWNTFMSHELFSAPNQSMTMLRVSKNLWRFWRFSRSLTRWALAKRGINYFKIDINEVHNIEKGHKL